jgi:hypothetical protein
MKVHVFMLMVFTLLMLACEKEDAFLEAILDKAQLVIEGKGIPEAKAFNPGAGGTHPMVIIHENGTNKDWNYDLPVKCRPSLTDSLQLVAYVRNPAEVKIDECCYNNNQWLTGCTYRIQRFQLTTKVEIREAKTGTLIGSKIFENKIPKVCPEATTTSMEIKSALMELNDILFWFRSYTGG